MDQVKHLNTEETEVDGDTTTIIGRVKLLSKDKTEVVEVDQDILKCSSTIWCMLESTVGDDVVPLEHVGSKELELIIKWAEQHKNDADFDAEKETDAMSELTDFDKMLFDKLEKKELFAFTCAVNFLSITKLLAQCCEVIQNKFKGLTPDQLREYLDLKSREDIKKDFFEKKSK